MPEAYSEPSKTSRMKLIEKGVDYFHKNLNLRCLKEF